MNIEDFEICKSVFEMDGLYYIKVAENMAVPIGKRKPHIILPSWKLNKVKNWRSDE